MFTELNEIPFVISIRAYALFLRIREQRGVIRYKNQEVNQQKMMGKQHNLFSYQYTDLTG